MALELYNKTTSISRIYSREFWTKALELAQVCGWRPIGTCPPSPDRFFQAVWDGTYLTNDGQTVLREDALSLAEALARSLDDIPDACAEVDWNPKFWQEEDELPEWLSPEEKATIEDCLEEYWPAGMDKHPFEFFAGAEKRYLMEFIRFCRLGSFMIW